MSTIYDIANACGVSIATVSRVLNGSSKVSPKTREKVLAAMREQNYSPNPFARGLGLDSMKMIGILCTDVSDAFFAKAVSLVEHGLRKRGLDVILGCSGTELSEKKKYLQLLLNKHVDAIILIGSPFRETNDNSHLEAAARQVPIVTINSLIDLPNVYSVDCDVSSGMKQVVELLAADGYTSILYLYDQLTYSGQQKLQGHREGLAECGLPEQPELIRRVERTLGEPQGLVEKLLDDKVPFSAIVTSEDLIAIGAQKALVARGIRMPVIGCNNSILAECSTPSLTSIDNRLDILCPTAVKLLTKILNGEKESAPSQTIFPPLLVFRDSFTVKNTVDK
jgi:LacI family transcriptional regulator